jgi:hypothetical protein
MNEAVTDPAIMEPFSSRLNAAKAN